MSLMVLPDECEDIVGRSSSGEREEFGADVGAYDDDEYDGNADVDDDDAAAAVAAAAPAGAFDDDNDEDDDDIAGLSWMGGGGLSVEDGGASSSLSGLAIRKPPNVCDRLRSPFIAWGMVQEATTTGKKKEGSISKRVAGPRRQAYTRDGTLGPLRVERASKRERERSSLSLLPSPIDGGQRAADSG